MRLLSKYWKALLALILAGAAAFLFVNVYQTEKRAYEYDKELLNTTIMALQQNIATNTPYKDVQEEITAEREKLAASRLDLYNHLPVDVKQEDQIMYVLYLESVFGTEIDFEFSEPIPVISLQDGSVLKSVDLIVNYRSTYQGFQDMINYLAQDYRVVSVDKANIKYYPKQDLAIGFVKIKLYLLDTSASIDEEIRKYVAPIDKLINVPNIGKENIFDNIYDQPSRTPPYNGSPDYPNYPSDPIRAEMIEGGQYDLNAKIWVTQHDGKYHSRYACGYMYSPVQVVFSEALAAGFQPCEKCFVDTGATELESTADEKDKTYNQENSDGDTGDSQSGKSYVWSTLSGDYYHSFNKCSGINDGVVMRITLAEAKNIYNQKACKECH